MGYTTRSQLLRLALPCTKDAPCLARCAVDDVDALEPVREDARLVASELVTNAVIHSGCGPGHVIEMTAELEQGHVLIKVNDPDLSQEEVDYGAPQAAAAGLGGFGLRIIQTIAQRWGTERRGGLTVWAEVGIVG